MKNSNCTNSQKTTTRWSNLFMFALLMVILQVFSADAAIYYSRQNGDWSNPATLSTVSIGGPAAIAVPGIADEARIAGNHTISITRNQSCIRLDLGLSGSFPGFLEFQTAGRSYSLTVNGNVNLGTGSRISYYVAATGRHSFQVNGSINNSGNIDLFATPGNCVDLIFAGGTSSQVSNGTWDLADVYLNKNAKNNSLNVQSNAFEVSIKNLYANTGTYIHNNIGSYSVNPSTNYTIGPNVSFIIPRGIMRFSGNTDFMTLQGQLSVQGGQVFVGSAAGLQGILIDRNGSPFPTLDITSGTLTVYGGITYAAASLTEACYFNMTGGAVSLNSGTTGTSRQVFWINDVTGSMFTMSGGTITINKAGTSTATDLGICGINGSFNCTGGIIQAGVSGTPLAKGISFQPFANTAYPNYTWPNLIVAGTSPSIGATLSPAASSTANFNALSLQILAGAKFDMRSINGSTSGDARTLTIKGINSNGDAFSNAGLFVERNSTVHFNPLTTLSTIQYVSGTTPAAINFWRMRINNSAHVNLRYPVGISSYLELSNGKLITTATNVLRCASNATTSIGTTASFVDGPMIHTAAATSSTKYFPIGKGFAFRPVELQLNHDDANPVTYEGEIINVPASALPPSLPPTIERVSNVRYTKFTRLGTTRFSSGYITMHYGTDDGVNDPNSLLVAQEKYPTPNYWMDLSQSTNGINSPVSGWVRSQQLTASSFNPTVFGSNYFSTNFALGNPPGGGNSLPINLVSFDAFLVKGKVEARWTTQTEVNNDYFTLERSSDNINYTPIGVIDGAGTTTVSQSYSFTDEQPLNGVSYYRLRQTDYDGHYEYFQVSVIENKIRSNFSVFPNPCNRPQVTLSMDNASLEAYKISVWDVTGREIPFTLTTNERGFTELSIGQDYFKHGAFYVVSATNGVETYQQKLIIE
ncbi:MAG: hypothetical protein RIQ47_297 [Bacteroidota bacterium]